MLLESMVVNSKKIRVAAALSEESASNSWPPSILRPTRPFLVIGRFFGGFPLAIKDTQSCLDMKYVPFSCILLIVYLVIIAALSAARTAIQISAGVHDVLTGQLENSELLEKNGITATDLFTMTVTWIPHAICSVAYFFAYKDLAPVWTEVVQATTSLSDSLTLTKGTC